ncbi:hypothetical protein AURANDRAFT_71609, partial [Aureococcus anophagefferens]
MAGAYERVPSSAEEPPRSARRRRLGGLAAAAALAAALGLRSRPGPEAPSLRSAGALRPSADLKLKLENPYEKRLGRPIGDALYPFTNLVDVSQVTNISLSSGEPCRWVVNGNAADGGAAAPWFEHAFDYVGTHEITAVLAGGENATFDVVSRVVRRELRELSDGERAKYFGALFTVYALSDDEGRAKYGGDFVSAAWLVREHLYGAADKACDHWHDDAGIMNHHVGITWQLENSLRAVDAETAAHYWDYTIDARKLDDNWRASPVFDPTWFSPATTKTNNESIVDKGRFAFTPVLDARNAGYSNQTNPYGLLRSPWNVNKVPYLLRYDYVLSDEYDGYMTFPKCSQFQAYLTTSQWIGTLFSALNGELHGPVHIMVGGLWGMNEKEWVAPLAENEDWFLLASKYMWRQGYVRCPETCSMDAPVADCFCECPSDVLAGMSSTEALNRTGVLGLFGGDASTFNSYGISDDQLLSELCHVGLPGEMFTSAAPQDPIFWPLHGNAERFLQYIRLVAATGVIDLNETWGYEHVSDVASDTGVVCNWDNATGTMGMPHCTRETCPGHRSDDLLPFNKLTPVQDRLYTNLEFYDKTGPGSPLLTYVYNSLSYWPGCTDDMMIVTDDGDIDDSMDDASRPGGGGKFSVLQGTFKTYSDGAKRRDGTALFYGGELARNKRLPCVLSVAPKTGVVCDAPLWTESDELDATSFCAGAKRGEEFLFFGGLDRYFRVTSLLRSAVSLRKKTGTSTAKKYLFRSYKASDDTPSPRYGCSFTYFAESGEMFLFGGFTASQAGSLAVVADDAKLYVLSSRDADADPWERTSPGAWSAVGGATGTGPGPRGLHACVAVGSALLLGGGLCGPKGPLCAEEVHAFDVDAKVWSTLAFDGPSVLVEAGADLDAGPPDGRGGSLSPLLLAVRKRKLDCVLLLIRAGVKGLGDGAFLREALRAGDSDAAVALVKAGEDPELADPETGEWPLYVAAAKNLVRVLEALRAGGRADMARVGGDGGALDPARAAAAAGHGDALRLLHVAGVDLRARSRVGDWTKLMRKKIKNAIRAGLCAGDLELHVLDDATVAEPPPRKATAPEPPPGAAHRPAAPRGGVAVPSLPNVFSAAGLLLLLAFGAAVAAANVRGGRVARDRAVAALLRDEAPAAPRRHRGVKVRARADRERRSPKAASPKAAPARPPAAPPPAAGPTSPPARAERPPAAPAGAAPAPPPPLELPRAALPRTASLLAADPLGPRACAAEAAAAGSVFGALTA